jgi:thioredoxin reductase
MGRGADSEFDVAIVGGGPAGLAAALVLGRMRRRVLLLDADDPAHARSKGVHGFFAHDGIAPLELRRIGREQLRPYDSVAVRLAEVNHVSPTPGGFAVSASGTTHQTGVVLLCPGLRYEPPPVPGVAELWCHGVYHCPYCHGWELRGRPLAVYGAKAASLALMLASLSDDVVLLTDGSPELDPEDRKLLRSAGVRIRHDPVSRVQAQGDEDVRVVFADGSTDDRAGLFLLPTVAPSPLVAEIACEVDPSGQIVVDEDGRTSVPGVFAAGDATNGRKSVVLAAAAGSLAGYVIHAGLARGTLPVPGPQ